VEALEVSLEEVLRKKLNKKRDAGDTVEN